MAIPSAVLIEIQYLPPVQFFSLFNRFEKVVIEQHENYRKGSYRNRCHIVGANGIARLSVPLIKGKNEQQNIKETGIFWHEPWAKRHWKTIQSAYGNAPYYEYYADELKPFFEKKYTHLFEWNKDLTIKLLELLQLDGHLEFTDHFEKEPSTEIVDYRNIISPKNKGLNLDTDFAPLPYDQVFSEKHGFLPNLSILDLLFCTGPEAINYL
jgi:hypothetical protein